MLIFYRDRVIGAEALLLKGGTIKCQCFTNTVVYHTKSTGWKKKKRISAELSILDFDCQTVDAVAI